MSPSLPPTTVMAAAGVPVAAVPGLSAPRDPAIVDVLMRSGAVSARPVYGKVQDQRVTMAVRAAEGGGIVTATIALPLMLERQIPWWIAEQYGVELVDAGGAVLAERSGREGAAPEAAHQISFDASLPSSSK